MKKIIFTFIMLAACAVGWAEDSETIGGNIANSNLTWEITVDSVLKISGSGDMPADFGSWDHEGGT